MIQSPTPRALRTPHLLADHVSSQRILVTGSSGFLGRRLVRRLHSLGAHAIGLDVVVDEGSPLDQFLLEDVTELQPGTLDVGELDAVVHLAAIVGVAEAWKDPPRTFEVNAVGTARLLDALGPSNPRKYILASSSAIYGEGSALPVEESAIPATKSPYGLSKVHAEKIWNNHVETSGASGVILRPFNVYGPGQRDSFVVARFVDAARLGNPLTIIGDGQQRRTFTYIDDFVDATILALRAPVDSTVTLNISSQETISINQLANEVRAVTGSESEIRYVSSWEVDRNPASEIRTRSPSVHLAQRIIGFTAKTTLWEGLIETAKLPSPGAMA